MGRPGLDGRDGSLGEIEWVEVDEWPSWIFSELFEKN
jgi:hypothetical protein